MHAPRMDITSDPQPRWADQPTLLADLASIDLADSGDIRPTLIAFSATDPLFLATLRPFDRGHYADAIIEAGAVAHALGARRIALSLAGRAWSTRDPIPPVLSDAEDMRQAIMMVHTVDGLTTPATVTSTIRPVIGSERGHRCLGEPMGDMPGEGWLVDILPVLVAGDGPDGPMGDDGLGTQIACCEQRGHQFAWGPRTLLRVQAALLRESGPHRSSDWLLGDAPPRDRLSGDRMSALRWPGEAA